MSIFLSVALLTYSAMHLYALGKVWQALPHSPLLGWALLLFGIAMTFSPFILWYLSRQHWHGLTSIVAWVTYLWMGFLFLFCSSALLLDLTRGLLALAGSHWQPGNLHTLLATTLLSLSLLLYGLIDVRQIRIEQVNLSTSKLPAGAQPITIAQISDLHLGAMLGEQFLERVAGKLRELQPDIIVATGDIVDGQGDDFARLAQQLRALRPPHGAYAVLGNHEFFAGVEGSLQFLRDAGFTVLRGEAVSTSGIVIAGIDDPAGLMGGQEIRLNARAALKTMPQGAYTILLKHQPVDDVGTPFDLQLSGHTHGGQIFPFGIFTRMAYHVSSGLTPLDNERWLYVSRGTGTWGPPLRLFAPPEITLIRISPRGSTDAR